jgi:cytochrome c oxidase subunit I
MISSIGAFGFGLSQLLFAYLIISSMRAGAKASDKVWDDAAPHGLEWTLSSPAPYHSFETAPEVK